MIDNQLQIVNFEQAKRLKELCFNWGTRKYYGYGGELIEYDDQQNPLSLCQNSTRADGYSAPSIALALKWFRDSLKRKFGINLEYCEDFNEQKYVFYTDSIAENKSSHFFDVYETAENELLNELLSS